MPDEDNNFQVALILENDDVTRPQSLSLRPLSHKS